LLCKPYAVRTSGEAQLVNPLVGMPRRRDVVGEPSRTAVPHHVLPLVFHDSRGNEMRIIKFTRLPQREDRLVRIALPVLRTEPLLHVLRYLAVGARQGEA